MRRKEANVAHLGQGNGSLADPEKQAGGRKKFCYACGCIGAGFTIEDTCPEHNEPVVLRCGPDEWFVVEYRATNTTPKTS